MTRAARLFIDLQHGLCNRLRALISAQAIAERTGRELVVIWRLDDHCQARIGDLLSHDYVVIEEDQVADRLRALAARVYNYMEIEPGSNFQEPIELAGISGDVYIRSAYTLVSSHSSRGAEDRILRALRPVEAVLEIAGRVAGRAPLAAHIRVATGPAFDHLAFEAPHNWPAHRHEELIRWRKESDVGRFIARLDQLIAEDRAERVFIAADRPESYEVLQERYGARLSMLERDLYDRSALQMQYALADLIHLASARYFLGSTWSSFSDVAQRIAPASRKAEFSGVDF